MLKFKRHLILGAFFFLSGAAFSADDYAEALVEKHGPGHHVLKQKTQVSFVKNNETEEITAKVTVRKEVFISDASANAGFVQIPFNMYEKLKVSSAKYFRLDSTGRKIMLENVKVKYLDEKDYFVKNIFYNDLKVKQFRNSVDLPKNFVLAYSYTTTITDLKFLNTFYLQRSNESVKKSELVIKKSDFVDFNVYVFNEENKMKSTESDVQMKYTATDLPKIKYVKNSVSSSHILPHVIISVGAIKKTNGEETIFESTSDMYNWYKSLIAELQPDTEYLKGLSDQIVEGSATDEEKIEAIFSWVQRQIKYIAFEDGIAGFKPEEAQEVCQNRFGDCKGMANLLVNLLKAQGFDARHVWIGTRSKPYSYTTPSLVVDNHMICALKWKDKTYFLDATAKTAGWEIAPPHLQGKEAMVANGETFEIIKVDKQATDYSKIDIVGNLVVDDNTPNMQLTVTFTGYFVNILNSMRLYSEYRFNKFIPYYLLEDFLSAYRLKTIDIKEETADKIVVSLQLESEQHIINDREKYIFPYLHLAKHERIKKNQAFEKIDFPYQVSSEIKVSPKIKINAADVEKNYGNNQYASAFSFKNDNGVQKISQTLKIDFLNLGEVNKEEWNTFLGSSQYEAHSKFSYNEN